MVNHAIYGHFAQNSVDILVLILMCGRLAVLTKRIVAILVVPILIVTGVVSILGVAILEWNRFDQCLYLLSGKTSYVTENLTKFRNRNIGYYNDNTAMKCLLLKCLSCQI